jgi:hypothetical protein
MLVLCCAVVFLRCTAGPLARAGALAALLLAAAEDGSNVADALLSAAACMELSGCARLWRV